MGKQPKKLEQMTLTDVLEMFVKRISTSLDDVVRRIVREELAKAQKQV